MSSSDGSGKQLIRLSGELAAISDSRSLDKNPLLPSGNSLLRRFLSRDDRRQLHAQIIRYPRFLAVRSFKVSWEEASVLSRVEPGAE